MSFRIQEKEKMRRRAATRHRVFKAALGWCAAARGREGYRGFVLPVGSADEAEALILELQPESAKSARRFRDLEEVVERYFDGWRTEFDLFPLDVSTGTPFQRKVWSIVRRIPYGRVRTYGWIGLEMGRPEAARAIGAAVGANPLPLLVPCHRVVASDGGLCGFSAQGGVDLKARMLELERVRLTGSGKMVRVLA
jgi:O-6-methylguanine DNA methyltransferase